MLAATRPSSSLAQRRRQRSQSPVDNAPLPLLIALQLRDDCDSKRDSTNAGIGDVWTNPTLRAALMKSQTAGGPMGGHTATTTTTAAAAVAAAAAHSRMNKPKLNLRLPVMVDGRVRERGSSISKSSASAAAAPPTSTPYSHRRNLWSGDCSAHSSRCSSANTLVPSSIHGSPLCELKGTDDSYPPSAQSQKTIIWSGKPEDEKITLFSRMSCVFTDQPVFLPHDMDEEEERFSTPANSQPSSPEKTSAGPSSMASSPVKSQPSTDHSRQNSVGSATASVQDTASEQDSESREPDDAEEEDHQSSAPKDEANETDRAPSPVQEEEIAESESHANDETEHSESDDGKDMNENSESLSMDDVTEESESHGKEDVPVESDSLGKKDVPGESESHDEADKAEDSHDENDEPEDPKPLGEDDEAEVAQPKEEAHPPEETQSLDPAAVADNDGETHETHEPHQSDQTDESHPTSAKSPHSETATDLLPSPTKAGAPARSDRAAPAAPAAPARASRPGFFKAMSQFRERSSSPAKDGRQRGNSEPVAPDAPAPVSGTASPPHVESSGRKPSMVFGSIFTKMRRPTSGRLPERKGSVAVAAPANRKRSSSGTRDGQELVTGDGVHRPTLRDQFQSLRKQGEHRPQSLGTDSIAEEEEPAVSPFPGPVNVSDAQDSTASNRNSEDAPSVAQRSNPAALPPNVSAKLPPGTASGITAGPTEEPRPVDWDLWQNLVFEGPSAVAKTSGQELDRAIASGIPAAIRGVVWQVLAESKSEDLENMYRSLKARSSTVEAEPVDSKRTSPTQPNAKSNGIPTPEKGTMTPAATQSEPTTRQGSTFVRLSSDHAEDVDLRNKLLLEKQKREAAAIAKLEKTIKRDMGSRTPYSKFTQSAGLQDGLFGVCKAYALFDEGVGYAQGLNFITMPMLFNVSEEEAFTLLVRLMNKYDLRSLFVTDMPGLHLRLYQFERLLEDIDPQLSCHLRRRHVDPKLYATQWFLTLFAYRFPLQLVLRVYDLVFSQGLSAILKFGLALMKKNRDALLAMKEMNHLTSFLKEKLFDAYIDKTPNASSLLDSGFFGSVKGGADKELYRADELVRDACDIEVSDATLGAYAAEWEEAQKRETEQAQQLENLKATNASLTARARELEARTQAQDAEHVAIAADLVRYKVESERLADENEELKVKTEELQLLVAAQPAQVEERLQAEMDRIMQRNLEVQNENRALKEDMDDMEQELVNVKVQHAQVQSDCEALKARWQGLQSLLGGSNSQASTSPTSS